MLLFARPQYLDSLAYADRMNLEAFKSIKDFTRAARNGNINPSIAVQNILGNLVLFMPFAFVLPCFVRNLQKWWQFLPIMFIVIFAVETIQLLSARGVFDVDDIILNYLGAVIAFGIWKTKFGQKISKYLVK